VSIEELESAVLKLSASERRRFVQWLSELAAEEWDSQIEADIRSGRFESAGKRAEKNFERGHCKPL
jgi:hypothetical protein